MQADFVQAGETIVCVRQYKYIQSPFTDWKIMLFLNAPMDLSNGQEDVRSGAEKDNKWLARGLKMLPR